MKTPNWKHAIAVGIAALALIAAGCGDDDELTKDEFIAQADEICTNADEELTATADEQFGSAEVPPSQEEQEAFISETVAPSLQEQHDQIAELNPPSEDADQVDAILEALQELADTAADDPASLLAGQGDDASALAQEYGLTSCGS